MNSCLNRQGNYSRGGGNYMRKYGKLNSRIPELHKAMKSSNTATSLSRWKILNLEKIHLLIRSLFININFPTSHRSPVHFQGLIFVVVINCFWTCILFYIRIIIEKTTRSDHHLRFLFFAFEKSHNQSPEPNGQSLSKLHNFKWLT